MFDILKKNLETFFPSELVRELLEAYKELKQNFYINKIRINEVEGGRFAEAAFRMLEYKTIGSCTPLGESINTDKIILQLSNIPHVKERDSIRLHIPRTLRVIYDIRNNRDAAHLGDNIDPNKQDASLVVACADWVLAEFIRLYHSIPPDEAQLIVENLIEKKIPTVQDFKGFLKTLNPSWTIKERILATLYYKGTSGATRKEISDWLKPGQKSNLSKTLYSLEYNDDLIYRKEERCYITLLGCREVEVKKMLNFN